MSTTFIVCLKSYILNLSQEESHFMAAKFNCNIRFKNLYATLENMDAVFYSHKPLLF